MIEINNKTRSRVDIKSVKGVAQKFLKYYNKRIRRGAANAAHANGKRSRLAAIPLGGSDHANVNRSRLAATNGDHANKNIEVSIAFIGDKAMRRLNKAYRKIDKTTDVLAFSGEDKFLGEVIINYAQVKRQAKKFGNNVQQELIFILTHGLLHLLGYDDKTEKGRMEMERMGERFIKVIGNL